MELSQTAKLNSFVVTNADQVQPNEAMNTATRVGFGRRFLLMFLHSGLSAFH